MSHQFFVLIELGTMINFLVSFCHLQLYLHNCLVVIMMCDNGHHLCIYLLAADVSSDCDTVNYFTVVLILCSTAVKDRIVAFLLFLGKLAITAAVGE